MSDIGDGGDGGHWLTVEHAAAALSRSSRTIRRMATDGRLPSRKEGARLLVNVSDYVKEPAEPSDVATLQGQVRELRSQVDRLGDLVDRQDSEIQFLRSALASALQLRRPAIEQPKERSWWQFWKSD